MTPKQALGFVNTNGIALESGRGPVPSLAETIAVKPIRGSWWKHPKGNIIFRCSRAIRSSREVLVCRLIEGKVTYVHRRLWAALVRWADELDPDRLAAIREIHTASGKHKVEAIAYPKWVPSDVKSAAAKLTAEEAGKQLIRLHDYSATFAGTHRNNLEPAKEGRVLTPMGHSHGRDNVKKRATRRKKAERLALAKKNNKKTAK